MKMRIIIIAVLVIILLFDMVLAKDKMGMFEDRINNSIEEQKATITPSATTGEIEEGSDELEDITITGEDKLKVRTSKPVLNIQTDINTVIPPYTQTKERLLTVSPPTFSIWSQDYSAILDSKQVAFPCWKRLVKEPVATFYPQTKGEIINSWSLVITDDKGREFKKFKGTYKLPKKLVWNGRNNKGRMISVDTTYTYVFSYIDVVGTPHTIVGKPFSIDAIVHQEKKGLVITLASRVLFEEDIDEVQLRPDAMPLIQEVADEIKNYFGLPIVVEAYEYNTSKAKQQAKLIAKLLAEKLIIWEKDIKTSWHKIRKQKPYIDIIIRNR
jgi:flagellar motor protein MotB